MATPDKVPERHASLLATLMALVIEKLIQSKGRGEKFLAPLEEVFMGKWKACTDPDNRVLWYKMVEQVRQWRRHVPTSPAS